MHESQPTIRRLCLAVDVESYSRRSRFNQLDAQNRLLWVMIQACRAAGVHPARCDRQNSGDGQILILPSGIDEGAVLPSFVNGLLTALHRVNHPPGPGGHVRLRVSLGQGAIQVGEAGFVAPAVITVCRLLDCDELRNALAASPGTDAAFIVTDDLYRDMFADGDGGLPVRGFRPLRVSLPKKHFAADAWINVPGRVPLLARVPPYAESPALERKRREASGGKLMDLAGIAAVAWAVYTGADHGGHDHAPSTGHHDDSLSHGAHHGLTDHGVTDHGAADHAATDHGITDYGITDFAASEYANADYSSTDYSSTDYSTDYTSADYSAADHGSESALDPGHHGL